MFKPVIFAAIILGGIAWAQCAVTPPATQPVRDLVLDLGNSVTMKFVSIPTGTFMMGSPADEKDRRADEGLQHQVRITRMFYMGVTLVTQKQWKAVMGKGPVERKFVQLGDDNAMGELSWNDATDYCRRLSNKTGRVVKLPTEAQWEYACRAGSQNRFYYGDDAEHGELGDYAWFDKNTSADGQQYPHAVGQKKPNAWGLYDMHGNVNQWCADWLGPYPVIAVSDPTGPANGTMRVFRGGSFMTGFAFCRDAARNRNNTTRRIIDNGCRVIVLARPGER